jgi:hypothetical protein
MTIDELDLELLVDRNEIAYLLGVGPTAVSNYVSRTSEKHPPFPEAVISRSLGRFRLYSIDDVEQWHGKAFPKRSDVWDEAITRLRQYRSTYCGET